MDGFPLERLLLDTGVERAFVIGVAPRRPLPRTMGLTKSSTTVESPSLPGLPAPYG